MTTPVIRPRGPRLNAEKITHSKSPSPSEDINANTAEGPAVRGALYTEAARLYPELTWTRPFVPILEVVNVETLLQPNRKPRRRNKKAESKIAASITEFGWTNPILVGRNNVVVAGSGRLAAARSLGMTQVPVIRLEHLTDEQLRLYAIADNKLAELSEWDNEVLALEFNELSDLELKIDLEITGFSLPEIEAVTSIEEEPTKVEDEHPQIREKAVSCLGDIFVLEGGHRLICADACDPATYPLLMQGNKARLVVTDPPYGVAISGFVSGLGKVKHREFVMGAKGTTTEQLFNLLKTSARNMADHTVDGGLHMTFMDFRHVLDLMLAGKEVYSELKQICVWVKPNGGMGTFYRSQHEFCVIHKVGKEPHVNTFGLGEGGRYRTNCWFYEGQNSFHKDRSDELAMHPTVKPVLMIMDAIKDCSHKGDIVLDAFGGSGTTLIAAHRTKRKAHLVELDPLYVDLIVRRWQKLTGKSAVSEADGCTFDELAKKRAGSETAND